MKKWKQLSCAFMSAVLVWSLLVPTELRAATPMPSFALQNVRDGELVDSQSFAGKVLLLTFFATWCPPCVEEIPVLNRLHADLGDAGFSVIGLSVDQQGAPVVARFVEKNAITYPVLLAEARTGIDFGGVYGIPVAFLVNKSGNVVKKYSGYVRHAVLEKDIKTLLN